MSQLALPEGLKQIEFVNLKTQPTQVLLPALSLSSIREISESNISEYDVTSENFAEEIFVFTDLISSVLEHMDNEIAYTEEFGDSINLEIIKFWKALAVFAEGSEEVMILDEALLNKAVELSVAIKGKNIDLRIAMLNLRFVASIYQTIFGDDKHRIFIDKFNTKATDEFERVNTDDEEEKDYDFSHEVPTKKLRDYSDLAHLIEA